MNLAGCSNRNVNRNLQNKPDNYGTVLEVQDNSILLEINKEGYPDGTRCKVSLNEKNRDNYAEVSVGDEVVVYYDGKIAESDPLQINTVYGINIKKFCGLSGYKNEKNLLTYFFIVIYFESQSI